MIKNAQDAEELFFHTERRVKTLKGDKLIKLVPSKVGFKTDTPAGGILIWKNVSFYCDQMEIKLPESTMDRFFGSACLLSGKNVIDLYDLNYVYRRRAFGDTKLYLPFTTVKHADKLAIQMFENIDLMGDTLFDMVNDALGGYYRVSRIIMSYDDNTKRRMIFSADAYIRPFEEQWFPINYYKHHNFNKHQIMDSSINLYTFKIYAATIVSQIAFWVEGETQFDPTNTLITRSRLAGEEKWNSSFESLMMDKVKRQVIIPDANIHTRTFVNDGGNLSVLAGYGRYISRKKGNRTILEIWVDNPAPGRRLICIASAVDKRQKIEQV